MKNPLQKAFDHLGEEMCSAFRWMSYLFVGYLWLCALLAPLAEYAYVGPWKFYKLWQKFCFSLGCAVGGYGIYRAARGVKTTKQKQAELTRIAA